jgi:riboflavin kinase/FMN adenylyltransferase
MGTVIRDDDECPRPVEGSAIAIGFFDGVHLGHRLVIDEVRRLAAERGARAAVVTFDPHPATVVRPDSAPPLLTDIEHRIELLHATGVDDVRLVTFDRRRSQESAEDFVRNVLVDCLHAKAVVVGADFHFGHQRRGTVGLLRAMGAEHGFEVDGIELLASNAEGARAVSSTSIRELLLAGDIVAANRMLGRPHEVRGIVEHGDKRGRELGFPTANVAVAEGICLPADGIYAGWYERPDGAVHAAAISLGRRPQFYAESGVRLLEAYLLDADVDLYGEVAKVRFVAPVRSADSFVFESVEGLVAQIGRDVVRTRELLG